jgi:hypothetical protein
MKTMNIPRCVILACLLALCGCGASGWEYKTVQAGSGMADSQLNQLGASQWELVGYSRVQLPGQSPDTSYIFKRRKTNPDWWKFWK